MPKINCSAENCTYNRSGICYSKSIKVEGVSSNKISDVHCISFANNDRCIQSNIESECEYIICNAINCVHNKNTMCECDNIFVSGNLAQAPKQTNCCSFLSRDN